MEKSFMEHDMQEKDDNIHSLWNSEPF